RRRHTRSYGDWSSDVCSSDLGIAARTGKSNFDISEWMLIRLLRALRGRAATLAMLCKTATARKVLRYAWQNEGRIETAALYRIRSEERRVGKEGRYGWSASE